MSSDPSNTGSNGRQQEGRFAPGNKFAKGNPNLRKMHALRSSLLASVDDKTMAEIGAKLAGLARGGDLEAIKILLAYTIGKPPTAVALTGPEGEPLGLDWQAVQTAVMTALAGFPEARLAVAMKLTGMAEDARTAGTIGDGVGPEPADEGGGPRAGPVAGPRAAE